jgi:hypothetical protein
MALKKIRIGSAEDIFQYDDGSFGVAIDTDNAPIKIGQSTTPEEALRQDQIPTAGQIISSDNVLGDNKVIRGDGGAKKVQDSDVEIDDSGNVNIPTGQGYKVNGTQVVTNQQTAESNISAVPDLTGVDTIDQSDLETYLGDIRTTINSLLSKLRSHGLIDT